MRPRQAIRKRRVRQPRLMSHNFPLAPLNRRRSIRPSGQSQPGLSRNQGHFPVRLFKRGASPEDQPCRPAARAPPRWKMPAARNCCGAFATCSWIMPRGYGGEPFDRACCVFRQIAAPGAPHGAGASAVDKVTQEWMDTAWAEEQAANGRDNRLRESAQAMLARLDRAWPPLAMPPARPARPPGNITAPSKPTPPRLMPPR
jgi:hypothetical protein